jgi:hypothetical protein
MQAGIVNFEVKLFPLLAIVLPVEIAIVLSVKQLQQKYQL